MFVIKILSEIIFWFYHFSYPHIRNAEMREIKKLF